MADFSINTRLPREKGKVILPNGYITVYISVAHRGETRYINTGLKTTSQHLRKTYNRLGNESYEVNDFFVIKECMQLIEGYMNKCNLYDVSEMSCKELVDFLGQNVDSISFKEFSDKYIAEMVNDGRVRPAANYRTALRVSLTSLGIPALPFRK